MLFWDYFAIVPCVTEKTKIPSEATILAVMIITNVLTIYNLTKRKEKETLTKVYIYNYKYSEVKEGKMLVDILCQD